jgi:hypothetical protein
MISKPNGYEEAAAFTGDYETHPNGGFVCVIMGGRQEVSRNGNPMFILALDIAEGEHKGFYGKKYKADTRENAKWPCVFRQTNTEASARYVKGLVTCIEQSNGNFKWDWDEEKLKGKLLGMLFRREEYEKRNGGTAWAVKPCQPRTAQKIREGDFTVPEDKPLNQNNDTGGMFTGGDFEPLTDEQMPF